MINKIKKVMMVMMVIVCIVPTVSNANYKDSRLEHIVSNLNEKYKDKTTLSIDYKSRNMDSFNSKIEDMTNDELYDYIEQFFINAENIEMKSVSSEVESNSSQRATQVRTNKVWCGIPAIGHGYIHIKYTVGYNLSTKLFTGASVTNSYQTGISLGSWTHQNGNRTSYTSKQINAVATGLLEYGVPGTPAYIKTQQHFKYVDTNRNF